MFMTLSFFAIFVACQGLLGLIAFLILQRRREIGIRKALGATAADIALMLSKSFVKWVLVANIFAWPMAYWFIKDWIEDYPYRINVDIGFYAIASVLALLVALLTVCYQTIKAAKGNPVDALRYE